MPEIKKKIIIADDDAGIIDAVSIMLDMAGYDVVATLNGGMLLSLQPEQYPDLILLDIWMSGEDGTEICRALKASEATRQIPVILFSASKEIEQSAFAAGADDFLAKPFEMNDLLNKISAQVNA
ncbi:MAG: response regulator [Chitinophagaceae bacterium]|nr:MAG: response regulator [Chitinophagaceae bacterium]